MNIAFLGRHPASGSTNYDPGINHICSSIQFSNRRNYPICSFGYLNWSGMRDIDAGEYRYFWTGIRHPAPIMTQATNIFAHQFIFKTVVTILCVVFLYFNWSGMREIHAGEYCYFWTGIRHPAPPIMTPGINHICSSIQFSNRRNYLICSFGYLNWSGMQEIDTSEYCIFGPASGIWLHQL